METQKELGESLRFRRDFADEMYEKEIDIRDETAELYHKGTLLWADIVRTMGMSIWN